MKKEKTFLFDNKLFVAANVLYVEVRRLQEKFIIQIEALNGKKFTEEVFNKEYSDASIAFSICVLFEKLPDDEYLKARQKADDLEKVVLEQVRKRIEEIKKCL